MSFNLNPYIDVSPHPIAALLPRVRYKPGWQLRIRAGQLEIMAETTDSLSGLLTGIIHSIPLPPHPITKGQPATWERWLLERLLDVERHEAGEFFQVDGQRPFMPPHYGSDSPYRLPGDPW